jgi:hypothetical protein
MRVFAFLLTLVVWKEVLSVVRKIRFLAATPLVLYMIVVEMLLACWIQDRTA